jgi:hypothetical protein
VIVQKRDKDNTLPTSDFDPSTRIYNIKTLGNYEIIMTLPMILLQFQNNFVSLKIVIFLVEKLGKLFKILETVLSSIPFDRLP